MKHLYRKCFACLCATAAVALPMYAQSERLPGQVTVSGKQLLKDGRPWNPHGFFQIAYTYYTPSEYADMRRAGADSVRINLAHDGANPENKYFFDAQWFSTVIEAVQAAREAGLSVIISIQNEAQTGSPRSPLPTAATQRVWKEFARIFGKDRGVLFELYNEPNLHPGSSPDEAPSNADWEMWAHAMNETLSVVRSLGAENVVVADGLVSAQQLSGAPKFKDPMNQVAYASHPYPSGKSEASGEYNQTKQAWDEKVGEFCQDCASNRN